MKFVILQKIIKNNNILIQRKNHDFAILLLSWNITKLQKLQIIKNRDLLWGLELEVANILKKHIAGFTWGNILMIITCIMFASSSNFFLQNISQKKSAS